MHDANVVGLPDEKWGQSVTAVVSLAPATGSDDPEQPDESALIAWVKERLAGYKCPKRVVLVDEVQRGPNGKPDYRWATEVATRAAAG